MLPPTGAQTPLIVHIFRMVGFRGVITVLSHYFDLLAHDYRGLRRWQNLRRGPKLDWITDRRQTDVGGSPHSSAPPVQSVRSLWVNAIGPFPTLIIDRFQKDVDDGDCKDIFPPLCSIGNNRYVRSGV